MQDYELMLVFKPSLPENIRKGILDRISTIIKQNEGDILNSDTWGKRYLSYAIKKHMEGYYVLLNVRIDKKYTVSINNAIQLIPDIIRHSFFQTIRKVNTSEAIKASENVSSSQKVDDYLENIDDIYITKI